MKTLHSLFTSNPLMARFGTYLAATATVGMLALGATALLTPAQADPRRELEELKGILDIAQVAELDQLAADFHGALSYGGNITAMMSLWAEHSSLTGFTFLVQCMS